MRELGLPKLQAWRWAPCAAFVLGSLSFVAFALVAIPERIGHVDPQNASNALRLGDALARTQPPSTPPTDWGDTTNTAASSPNPSPRSLQPGLTQSTDSAFPKRGFTPPLERPEPPAPPPQLTPAQQQPQLNVPPPVPAPPAPATEPAAPAPPPPAEVVPQAAPPPAPSGEDAQPAAAPTPSN